MATAMTAKFFVLSLMINLIGRGYIRRLFDRAYPTPPENLRSSRSQNGRADQQIAAHTIDVELQPRGPGAIGASAEGLNRCPSDDASIKSSSIVNKEDGLGHIIHNIELDSKPVS
ncbi:unnamed protein product [Rhizoctonia solani]|uniref:Uncharacterized protein n=1 Tax=Rhizoctonia solani TaxID=456999 RepID=A0A8H3DGA5_9AGAM|nr:unnamed protein product [Rhizoctonia solani]